MTARSATLTVARPRAGHPVPRLARCIQWTGILSDTETESAIRDHRQGFGAPGFGCEAVAHFGGPTKLIRAAITHRHVVRMLDRLNAEEEASRV